MTPNGARLDPRALAAIRLKRWEDAESWTSVCLKKCPFESKARRARAQARLMLKRYEGAAEDFSTLIAGSPRHAHYYEQRALCHEGLGKHDLARADRARADKVAGRPKKAE